MRILFVSTCFPHRAFPVTGTYNLQLCRALAEHHQVRVWGLLPWTHTIRAATARQTNRRQWADQTQHLQVEHPVYFYPPGCLRDHYGWMMWASVRRRLRHLLKTFTPDCVVSYWAHPDGELGLRIAERVGVPSAVIIGGSDVLVLTQSATRRRRVEHVLQNSSAVVTVSDGLRQRVMELGVPSANAHTIYQGIDPQMFSASNSAAARHQLGLPADRRILAWIGRMVPVKQLDVLIAACGELRRRRADWTLYLLGDGPLREQLQRDIQQRKLEDCIRLAGPVAQADLPDWYRAADLTVLSSASEGLPNVLRESLACHTPFVATDVGSIREIADPRHSILVPASDPQALANAIDRGLSGQLQRATCDYAARTWSDCADDFSRLLQSLTSPTDAHPSADGPSADALAADALPL